MHFCSRVIERRYAEEGVLSRLTMMILLCLCRVNKRLVRVQNRLWEAGCTRGKIDCGIVLVADVNIGCFGTTIGDQLVVAFGISGTIVTCVNPHLNLRYLVANLLYATDKFGTEYDIFGICFIEAVGNFVGSVAEIKRHRKGSCAENAEINR